MSNVSQARIIKFCKKAKNIEIHVDSNDDAKIIISDDGKGINEEDLQLCVKRHATSKISNNDLELNFIFL